MALNPSDSPVLGTLFGTDAMRAAFDERAWFQRMLDVEAALARVQARLGIIPADAADAITAAAHVDNLVIAMCTFPEELTESEIARRLELLWEDRLRYGFWEAHATLVDNGQVELEAATRASQTGHYITLHIVAQRGFVPAQRVAVD